MKKLPVVAMMTFAVIVCLVGIPMQAQGVLIESGSRTTPTDVTAGGNWANGFEIQWSISEGGLGYIYTYALTSDGSTPLVGGPSHLILEVSLDAPNALYKVDGTFLTPQIWGSSPSNPGIPGDVYGIKLDFGATTYSFESTQAPMWGDFYSKDGEAGGLGVNYAYNSGFGTTPTSPFGGWIRVPDTTRVPEPGTVLLLGTGLVMMAGFGRRKLRK
jgi:hypothetical protein